MRVTIHCENFRSMSDHKTCNVGVEYAKFKGMAFKYHPCFCKNGETPNQGCDLAKFPTTEELAKRDAEDAARFQRVVDARHAIVNVIGPWKRGQGFAGKTDCPVCRGSQTLTFRRAGYNGHIHATCMTEGCVQWVE